ncbi:MAG: DUF4388 domain-containing protein [Desulfovibrionales bacterium]
MSSISKLTRCLLQRAEINEFQLLQAEDYALTRDIPLEDALLFLEYVDFAKIGECLSLVYEKPYLSLLRIPPVDAAKQIVPLELAKRYTMYPARFDAQKNTILLAVSDPTDPLLASDLPKLFAPELHWEFCVAPGAEIKQAIEVHYLGRNIPQSCRIDVPEDFEILPRAGQQEEQERPERDGPVQDRGVAIVLLEPDRRRAGAIRTLLSDEGYENVSWALSPREAGKLLQREGGELLVVNGTIFKAAGPWLREIENKPRQISYYEIAPLLLGHEYAYGQMSDALLEMVAFWTRKSLRQNTELLSVTLERVKYCKLLGLRAGLRKTEIDGVVLAAWLSCGAIGKEAARKVGTPYRIEDILGSRAGSRIESVVLKMVMAYQLLLKKNPEIVKDGGALRTAFRKCIDVLEPDALIETFLRIIKEEEFLGRVGQGEQFRIIIVDPEASDQSPLVLRLKNEGYGVELFASAKTAMERITRGGVNLIVSEMELGETEGLEFCRMLKQWPQLSSIPIVILTGKKDSRLHAASLGAGADDFFVKPPDLEAISLKISRLLGKAETGRSAPGVRGSLREMSTVDFLQSLSAGEKDVEIVIEQNQQTGRIFMKDGEIIHAELSNLQGEEAFYGIVPWEEGDFVILPCSRFPQRTIRLPLESMLIEGFRRVDEAKFQGQESSEDVG